MNSIYGLFRRNILVLICCMSVLTGCGHSLPVADDILLQQKKAVLIVTGNNLKDSQQTVLDDVLASWNRSHQIAYHWLRQVEQLDEQVKKEMVEKPYDYIFIAGNELLASAGQLPVGDSGPRFVLLEDRYRGAVHEPNGVMYWKFSEEQRNKAWSDWVREKREAGTPMAWVTARGAQIPAAFLPAHHQEITVVADVYGREDWSERLAEQVELNDPQWIILYSSLEQEQMDKIKSLGVPVIDMTADTDLSLNWKQVWESQLQMVKNGLWKPGEYTYPDDWIIMENVTNPKEL